MKAKDYHRSMEPLKAACSRARSGWVCLPVPLTSGKTIILLRHGMLVFRVWKNRRRRVLVREFSILPLLAVFPMVWPLRKNVWFVIHHNLQWAVRSPLQRFGMRCLALLGAQWALLETQDFHGLEKFKIPSSRNLVLPHPVSGDGGSACHIEAVRKRKGGVESPPRAGCPKGGVGFSVIGVAGYYRPEKGTDDLIRLLKKKLPEFEILLGVPNPEDVTHLDVETVCTATDAEYHQMLSRCDVLVLNGEKESYFYRASGPVADAAAVGTAVVAPDFPIIGKQVAGIGEVFQSLDLSGSESAFGTFQKKRPEGEWKKMPEAIRTAVAAASAGKYDFQAYCKARSEEALADGLDEFVEKSRIAVSAEGSIFSVR